MKGTIIVYYPDVEVGLISVHDGEQYRFSKEAWCDESEITVGQKVTFVLGGHFTNPRNIRPDR
jgi:hypothetical protein